MSARPAILFSLLLIVLLPTYFAIQRHRLREISPAHERANLLELSGVQSVTISRANEQLRFDKTADGKLYQVVEPPGGFVPHDLMNALVALLMKSGEVEVVADNTRDLAEYGLDHPTSELLITSPGRPAAVKLYFGSENPTHTAIYARMENSPKIFLLGLDLRYYQDLMFEWIEGKQGKQKS